VRDKFYAQVNTKLKKSNVAKVMDKLKEGTVTHDKRVGRIIKAQKALDIKGYTVTEIGYMSDKEKKDTLDRLETKIEAEKKKGNLKDYVLSHLE
jgi:hypothetical protein